MKKNVPKKGYRRSIDGVSGSSISGYRKVRKPARSTRKADAMTSAPGQIRPLNSFTRSLDGFKSSSQSIISAKTAQHKSVDLASFSTGSSKGKRGIKPVENKSFDKKKLSPVAKNKTGNSIKSLSLQDRTQSKKKLPRLGGRLTKRRIITVIFIIVFVLVALIAARVFLFGKGIFKGGGNSAVLNSREVDPSMLRGEGDGRVNVLILGKGGSEQEDGPDLTDTIIVASIDPISKEAALVSVPRDLWVKTPSGGSAKINQIYYEAKHQTLNSSSLDRRNSSEVISKAESIGIKATSGVVSEALGIPIHYYTMVDFAGFRKAIDTIGGIDIDVSEDLAVREQMRINGPYLLDVEAGSNHFDGNRALAFSRSRKTSARGDYARSDRQRAVMIGMKEKALSSDILINPIKINQLMSDFSGQVETDFSVNEMVRVYDLMKDIPSNKIQSISLEEYIVGDILSGLSVQVPKLGMHDYSEIQSFIRNTLRDSFLKKEDAKIKILNGTDVAGLATKKSVELKSYGYNIISVADAPSQDYVKSQLIDVSKGEKKYTKSYLEKRLKLISTDKLPQPDLNIEDADFVIILGVDEANI